ncbi:MAG: STAS domain-containing protein [Planctomycetota bacterium]|jgi:anti-anti-sigma factor
MSKVLVASSMDRNARDLVNELEAHRYTVRHFQDGEGALCYLQHAQVDCALVELNMVDMSAEAFMAALAQYCQDGPPPLVLTGTLEEAGEAGKLLPMGSQAFLPHPYDMAEVRALIGALLQPESDPSGCGQVLFEVEEGALVIRLPARLEHANAASLLHLVEGGLCSTAKGVVVDASHVEYICSTAIGALHLIAYENQSLNGRLFLSGASARVNCILEIAGIFVYYTTSSSVDESLSLLT